MGAFWLEYAALAVAYSLLATAVLETLLRLWRVKDPSLALGFRLSNLAIPPVAPILFSILGPGWGSEQFRRQSALLDLHRWLGSDPGLFPSGWSPLLAVLAATTLLSLGLGAAGYRRRPRGSPGPPLPMPADLQLSLKGLAARQGCSFPVRLVEMPEATACTVGLRQTTILLTTGLLKILDREELEAVVAHEMAHGRRRDNRLGWFLFGLRLASIYNPVALLTFHQIGHDMERICDGEAARVTGKPVVLASALLKVHQAGRTSPQGAPGWSRRISGKALALEDRARGALVEDRIRRLLHPEGATRPAYPRLRLALATAAVVGLVYLVV